jgi:hypothetical protein
MKRVRLIGETFATNVAKERYGGEGCTLGGYLAEAANGVELNLDDPWGAWHTVSLEPFAGQDPESWLVFTWIESNNGGFGDDAPAPDGHKVILKEFDFPADAEPPEVIPRDCGDGTLLEKYRLPPGVNMIELTDRT